jgi:hypothetical protein
MPTLKVNVMEANNLFGADLDGKSDPYCVLKIGEGNQFSCIERTRKIKNTKCPTWKETFTLNVNNPLTECLFIEVLNKESRGKDNSLGFASMPIHDLTRGIEKQVWLELEGGTQSSNIIGQIASHLGGKKKEKVNEGKVFLGVTALDFGLDPSTYPPGQGGMMHQQGGLMHGGLPGQQGGGVHGMPGMQSCQHSEGHGGQPCPQLQHGQQQHGMQQPFAQQPGQQPIAQPPFSQQHGEPLKEAEKKLLEGQQGSQQQQQSNIPPSNIQQQQPQSKHEGLSQPPPQQFAGQPGSIQPQSGVQQQQPGMQYPPSSGASQQKPSHGVYPEHL